VCVKSEETTSSSFNHSCCAQKSLRLKKQPHAGQCLSPFSGTGGAYQRHTCSARCHAKADGTHGSNSCCACQQSESQVGAAAFQKAPRMCQRQATATATAAFVDSSFCQHLNPCFHTCAAAARITAAANTAAAAASTCKRAAAANTAAAAANTCQRAGRTSCP
jgi:hypothetical protein